MPKPTRLALASLAALLALLAAPMLSCVSEVDEVPVPTASVAELSAASPEDGSPRERSAVNVGGGAERLAYLRGSSLRIVRDPEAESVDPFAFIVETPDGEHVAPPDFSALTRRGYRFAFSGGDYLRTPVYATTSQGDVYYFEGHSSGPRESSRFGYAVAHATPGRDAELFEVPTSAYAVFPSALLVRGANDVFVGASIVKEGTFGPDFPGCPISILHGQNGVYLAHLDADGLRELPFPGEGRLDSLSLTSDGDLVVDTGWPEASPDPSEPNVRERWKMSPRGAWTRVSRAVAPKAATE